MEKVGHRLAPDVERAPELEIPSVLDRAQTFGSTERTLSLARLLWGERRRLFRFTRVGFLVAFLIALLLPNRYESVVRLMPPDPQTGSGLLMLLQMVGGAEGSGLPTDLLGVRNSGEVLIEMLESRTLQDRLIARFHLKEVYGVSLASDARRGLSSKTVISLDRKSGFISITVSDSDPERAQAIARSYVEELDRLVAALNTSAAHRERVFIEGRLKAVKEELDTAAKDLSEFSSKNVAIDPREQGRSMVDAAARLQGELIAAESELMGLRQIYTPNNIRVRATQARVSELRSQLDKLGGKDPAKSGADAGSIYPSLRKLPLLAVQYGDLYRRAKVLEVVYETLTKQYELSKVAEAKEIPSISVLDRAEVPEHKSGPPRILIALSGAFLSLLLGTVWIIIRDGWQDLDPMDARKRAGWEVYRHLETLWLRMRATVLAPLNFVTRRLRKRQHSDQDAT